MAAPSEPDIATLQADIQQLRADFAKMATTMRDVAGSGIVKVGDKAQASAEKAWVEVKRQAQQVGCCGIRLFKDSEIVWFDRRGFLPGRLAAQEGPSSPLLFRTSRGKF